MRNGLIILLFCLFAVFSVKVKNELRAGRSPLTAIKAGQPMPDFSLPDRSGGELALSSALSENRVVMINFWASWCGPCRVEMPGFEKLYTSRGKEGLVILGINEDESIEDMENYLARRPVSFPILLDRQGEIMKRFGVRALPTTILIGPDGKVSGVFEGVVDYMDVLVDGMLKEPSAQ